MDKVKIGKFLKQLREEKKLSQVNMSMALVGGYSDAAISKWETGNAVPNIQDLNNLAKYFGVTIDEILNGERNTSKKFEEIYFICDSNWAAHYDADKIYDIQKAQELLIEKRFKELLKMMVEDGLSASDDAEFDFLANSFYQIFLPAVECKDDAEYRSSSCEKCVWCSDLTAGYYHDVLPGGLADIKFEIYRQSALMHNLTVDEKFWEANKKFVFPKRLYTWDNINNAIEDDEDKVHARILQLDDCEKDILLATLQTKNVEKAYATREGYEEKYRYKYDEEVLTKRAIKLLIECGAKLNKELLGYWSIINYRHDIVNELIMLHKKYKSPLLVPICEGGRYSYYTVKNTPKNRAKLGIKYENECFDESDYLSLEKRLYDGEKEVIRIYKFWPCGENIKDMYIYAKAQMSKLSLGDYMRARDGKKTDELLTQLDRLSLKEIREKYFPVECKGEFIEDSNKLSAEELNRKYYLKGASNE